MKPIAALALLLCSFTAWACEVPPREQYVPSDELIARTKNIVLAKAVKAELLPKGWVLYTFETQRWLKGSGAKTFKLRGAPATAEGDIEHFNLHFDQAFWTEVRGRTPNWPDCEIHPPFSVGGTYLVFQDRPFHIRSFELIVRGEGDVNTKDKWLQYVESALASGR